MQRTPTVMFSSPYERAEYFGREYNGEWKFEFNTGAAFDSNVAYDATGLNDYHWDYETSLGYEWWVSKALGVVITPSMGMEGSRFDKYRELDGDVLSAGLVLAILDKLPVDVEVGYLGGWGFSGGFGDQVLIQHDVSARFAKAIPLVSKADGTGDEDGPMLKWRLGGGHVFSDPSSDDQAHGDASLELSLPVDEQLSLVLGTGLSYLSYTDSSVGSREAWLFQAAAAIECRPLKHKDLFVAAGVGYTHRADNDSSSDYDQWLVSLSIRFEWEHLGFNLFKN